MKITMAHGSGGRSSARLINDVFGKHFKNNILDKMEDAAVLNIESRTALSTDSFVVTPLVFKGGDIGKLCICGTANDLLMMGAVPKYMTCGFIIEEGMEMSMLDKIVGSMAEEAAKAGVTIVAGDTKVIEGNGGLCINTTGIGLIPEGRSVSAHYCKPGDVIILSGDLGDHHACVLSHRMGIDNDIKSDCAVLSDIVDSLFEHDIKVRAMRDVTRGGLATVMNEIADSSGCRMELDEEAIPVNGQVKGLAGILGLDPLYMGNEGKMIAIVPEKDGEKALKVMKDTEHGRGAAIIGHVGEGSGTYMNTRLGAVRKLDMLYGEGLPRIC